MERFTACCPENGIETVYSRCGTGSGGALVQSALLIVAGLLLLIVALVLPFTYYRCHHCSRFLDRSDGEYCPYCGKKME